MAGPEHTGSAPEPAMEADAGTTDQQGMPDLVKKVAHEVDTNDMFVQGGE